jgi:hypothetical protein
MRANADALAMLDAYAENVGRPWRAGFEATRSSRSLFHSRTLVILDEAYSGAVDGRPEVLRQFTTVVGARGLALLFRYIEPDEPQSLDESSGIAMTWRVDGR